MHGIVFFDNAQCRRYGALVTLWCFGC